MRQRCNLELLVKDAGVLGSCVRYRSKLTQINSVLDMFSIEASKMCLHLSEDDDDLKVQSTQIF